MSETGPVVPDDLLYSTDHQWVRVEQRDGVVVVRTGLTDYAQETLGAVQFISLPSVGASFASAEPCGEAEASKAVSDLYAPVAGSVFTVNEQLVDQPSLVNQDPYGTGWLYELATSPAAFAETTLLGPRPYRELIP